MTDTKVEVIVSGFRVDDPSLDREEMADVARELVSDIGVRLADLGRSCGHGEVTLRYGGMEASSSD